MRNLFNIITRDYLPAVDPDAFPPIEGWVPVTDDDLPPGAATWQQVTWDGSKYALRETL